MILELQNVILEMIAKGEPLQDTIEQLCLHVEAIVPSTVCTVVAIGEGRLHPLAAPSLPDYYSAALDNVEIGAFAGSCGTAAYQETAIAVTDIEHDPRWADFKHLAMPLGFKACWSTPVFSGDRVVATFAFYYRVQRGPSELEQTIVDACVHLCAIAIERDERVRERQRLTYTDALTGLPNRAKFNQVLSKCASDAYGSWGILLADMDNLKLVNDTFGHATGDNLIQIVAQRIASIMTPERTFRIGGDEFAVLVQDTTSLNLSIEAGKIITGLKRSARCNGHVIVRLFPV
jgi:GGDEF domain-containing protein